VLVVKHISAIGQYSALITDPNCKPYFFITFAQTIRLLQPERNVLQIMSQFQGCACKSLFVLNADSLQVRRSMQVPRYTQVESMQFTRRYTKCCPDWAAELQTHRNRRVTLSACLPDDLILYHGAVVSPVDITVQEMTVCKAARNGFLLNTHRKKIK